MISASLERRPKAIRRLALIASLICVTLVGEGLESGVAEAQVVDVSSEQGFVDLLNQSRANAGLGPFSVDGQLVDNARAHSSRMASSGSIYHNSQLPNQITGNWQTLGENVGTGGSTSSIHDAFMASASHRANLLGDYDRVGVGAVVVEGTIFVTQVFWKTASTQSVSAAPVGQTLAAAPATVSKCRVVRGRRKCSRVKAKVKRVKKARRRR